MSGVVDGKLEVFLSKTSELMMSADLLLVEVINMTVNDILKVMLLRFRIFLMIVIGF